MRDSAARLGLDWQLPPLAVTFASGPHDDAGRPARRSRRPAYGNLHGRPRADLPALRRVRHRLQRRRQEHPRPHLPVGGRPPRRRHPRPGARCAGIAPLPGGGYEVRYVVHDPADEGRQTTTSAKPLQRITCDRLVLGAGTFGTTLPAAAQPRGVPRPEPDARHPVLRQRRPAGVPARRGGPGRRRAGAGASRPAAGRSSPARSGSATRSTATGAAGRGFYVEDAGYPVFVDWLVETTQMPGRCAGSLGSPRSRLRRRLGRLAEDRHLAPTSAR